MADRSARFTDLAELVAYLSAQAAGLIWNFTINATIVGRLIERGHRDTLSTSLALSIASDIVVLALFLLLRWLLAKTGRGQRQSLTDLREIGAYVLVQVIEFVFSIFVLMPVLGSLYRSGVQNLTAASFALNVVSILLALPVFLFLRRIMTANVGQQSRGAAGFGFGLAFIAWVIAALTVVNATGMPTGMSVSDLLPWLFNACVAASLAAWAGGSAAYALTRFQRSRLWRTAVLTIAVPCIAVPVAAMFTMVVFIMACARQMGVAWSLRAGGESAVLAIFAGRGGFGAPYLLATLLWSFYYLRPSR
ncbi:MAG TPA: hypothetical protein VGM96_08180 [Reyranella sp.]